MSCSLVQAVVTSSDIKATDSGLSDFLFIMDIRVECDTYSSEGGFDIDIDDIPSVDTDVDAADIAR